MITPPIVADASAMSGRTPWLSGSVARAPAAKGHSTALDFEASVANVRIGGNVYPRMIVMTLVLGLLGAGACLAAAAPGEVWKLDEAKSTLAPGASKDTTLTYTIKGEQVKIVVDGVTAKGKPFHSTWEGKYDGKDYPVKGDPASDARSYRVASDRALEVIVKKGGKTVASGQATVARGGQTRTFAMTVTGADGKSATSTAVYVRP